jgi:hypothetical protein
MAMSTAFETVYTIVDWYDGPRDGAADFRGVPHRYRSVYLDAPEWNSEEDRFELTPISAELLAAMIEADRLWRRWDDARRAGTLPEMPDDAPRVLPEDRPRYAALTAEIDAALARRAPTVLAHGVFQYRPDRVQRTPVEIFPAA